MSKPFLTEKAPILSSAFFIIGLALTVIGIVGLAFKDTLNLGDWDWWLALIGIPLLLTGVIWLWMYLARIRQFHKALTEKSKAAFLKEMDDTEYLAWRLPMKYEEELEAKKAEFGIK